MSVEPLETLEPQIAPILAASTPSGLQAWCYLVWLCMLRQARARQMVWIAIALLAVTACLVTLGTVSGRWGMSHWNWRWPPGQVGIVAGRPMGSTKFVSTPGMMPGVVQTYGEVADSMQALAHMLPRPSPALALENAVAEASRLLLKRSGFYVFTTWLVLPIFVGFLLPIWSLSFATDALGGERESGSLVWLLTRPLSRPSIYLAKFLALLPMSLALNLGGFGILCALAGQPGHQAFRLYWPAVVGGSLAFCSLFHLMGALFRRAAVVALVYAFFLETILGSMPGYMKRISISFYTRCLMFDAAQGYGVQVEKPSIYLPVSGAVAWSVLLCVTVALLLVGMVFFARKEYQDLA